MEDRRADDVAHEPDPLIGEIQRERRDRRVLVLAAAIGIISGAVIGMVFLLGVIHDPSSRSRGFFGRHEALFCILGAPALCMAIGYAIFVLRRRRSSRRSR